MDVSSINSDLIRGNVTTIILKALLDEDRYGYDILREIEVKSGGQYKLKQPLQLPETTGKTRAYQFILGRRKRHRRRPQKILRFDGSRQKLSSKNAKRV